MNQFSEYPVYFVDNASSELNKFSELSVSYHTLSTARYVTKVLVGSVYITGVAVKASGVKTHDITTCDHYVQNK